MSDGSCFEDSLREAGVDISAFDIPHWISINDIPVVCNQLNLTWYGDGEIQINENEPVIVLYRTQDNKGHAVFLNDIGPLLNTVEIIGIICLSQ